MASDQIMMQTKAETAVEATKAVISTVYETESSGEQLRTTQSMPRMSRLMLKQPAVDWKVSDKYNKQNFEIEFRNIFLINSYNIIYTREKSCQ